MRPNFRFIKTKTPSQPEAEKPTKSNRTECPNCKGKQYSSFSRDGMPWRKCLTCPHVWTMGGNSMLAKVGEDKHSIYRELLREPDLIQVTSEVKRNYSDWEQDQEILERNTNLYNFYKDN